jgi:TrmH family RNA methyltransferase
MERITSRQNAIVKRFRDLARPRRGGASTAASPGRCDVLLDGEHLIEEALASEVPIEIAAFTDRYLADAASPGTRLAREVERRGGRAVAVGERVLTALSPVQHPSGLVAIGQARLDSVESVLAGARRFAPVLVLAGLQDPGNLGAIVRAAAAFGASGVIALEGSADPFGWKALRGAMGGTFRIPIARATMPQLDAAARAHQIRVLAALPHGGTALPDVDFAGRTAILLGAEGAGVPAEAAGIVHGAVTIPMRQPVDSLNVAVAAALILYESARLGSA